MSIEKTDQIDTVRDRLVPWFRRVARDLPWRQTTDPYRIWLSEIMLQQTRAGQAESYYHRFVDRYPTVGDLASAELDEILRDWEGLGYYARARNIHRAAQLIVRDMGGVFPSSHEKVASLPGVGTYTAAAVMSIAYDEPFAAVDGNVIRVLSRLFELEDDPTTAKGKRRFLEVAEGLLDRGNPGTFNEAMMELGATVCLPSSPACPECPVSDACGAYLNGRVARFPTRRPKKAVPHFEIAVALIFDPQDRVFIQKRAEDGMLGGLWEFPGGKIEDGEAPEEACRREACEELGVTLSVAGPLDAVGHTYSHFTVRLHPFVCRLRRGTLRTTPESRWIAIDELSGYAFPRANRKIIEALQAHGDSVAGPPTEGGVHS